MERVYAYDQNQVEAGLSLSSLNLYPMPSFSYVGEFCYSLFIRHAAIKAKLVIMIEVFIANW